MSKHFFTHAASLHQGSPHCAISPTAASRRSLGRVSVPMWPFNLSVRLPIVALVGRCPANWLIRRGSISTRLIFSHCKMPYRALMRYYQSFPTAIPRKEAGSPRVTHPSATKIKQIPDESFIRDISVRLACVRHAASVHPEPGSNSHVKCCSSQPDLDCLSSRGF